MLSIRLKTQPFAPQQALGPLATLPEKVLVTGNTEVLDVVPEGVPLQALEAVQVVIAAQVASSVVSPLNTTNTPAAEVIVLKMVSMVGSVPVSRTIESKPRRPLGALEGALVPAVGERLGR